MNSDLQTEETLLSFGEKLVGIKFNPSNNSGMLRF